jgi:hypothetical protein
MVTRIQAPPHRLARMRALAGKAGAFSAAERDEALRLVLSREVEREETAARVARPAGHNTSAERGA